MEQNIKVLLRGPNTGQIHLFFQSLGLDTQISGAAGNVVTTQSDAKNIIIYYRPDYKYTNLFDVDIVITLIPLYKSSSVRNTGARIRATESRDDSKFKYKINNKQVKHLVVITNSNNMEMSDLISLRSFRKTHKFETILTDLSTGIGISNVLPKAVEMVR